MGSAESHEECVDPADYRAFHRVFASGVTIVTTELGGEFRGLVANAFTAISMAPPLISIAVNRQAATHEFLYRTDRVAINIASAAQDALVRTFSSPVADKFEDITFVRGANGCPTFPDSSAVMEGRVLSRLQAFSHTVFVIEVTKIDVRTASPIVYLGGQFFDAADLGVPLGT